MNFTSVGARRYLNNTEVLYTSLGDTVNGIIMVIESTTGYSALYRIEAGTLSAVSANTNFSTTKGTTSHYNLYFEDSHLRLQNLVGDNKTLEVLFSGS